MGVSTKQKWKQEIQTTTILQDFFLMLLFNELRRLFVPAFSNGTVNIPNNPINNSNNRFLRNSHTEYFLPTVNISNHNVLIDGRNFYDQPIHALIKQSDKIRKTSTG